jgi:hypothetical protein
MFLHIIHVRDQLFDTLFASMEKDPTMNGLPQSSVHIYSHEVSCVFHLCLSEIHIYTSMIYALDSRQE